MQILRPIVLIFTLSILFPIFGESQELDKSLFKASSMISLETARNEMKQVYLESGQTKTLYCGCFFDKQKQVYPNICDFVPKRRRIKHEKKILKWVHAMPRSAFAASMNCWEKSICTRTDGSKFKGTDCCSNLSPKFKSMESDMHNLIPTFDWFLETKNDSYESVQFGGMGEYKMCVNGDITPKEPTTEVRGNLARAYLYMSFQYRIPIQDELEDRLRVWHLQDLPDEAENRRNSLIELVQENRNPFIDYPEIVERVENF